MNNWLNNNFDGIANWCSILGLVITLFVLFSLKNIRKHFKSKGRFPEIVSQLEEFSMDLNACTNNIEASKNEIIAIIKRLEFTLKSLRKISNDQIVKNIDILITRISRLKNDGPFHWNVFIKSSWSFKKEIWDIYTDIQGLLQGIKEADKDSVWSEQ